MKEYHFIPWISIKNFVVIFQLYSILGRVFANSSLDRISVYRKKRRESSAGSCGYVLTAALRMEAAAPGTVGVSPCSKVIPAKPRRFKSPHPCSLFLPSFLHY